MMIRRTLVTGLASLAILFSVSCGGQDSEELAELRNAVNSLQQEVESLRAALAQNEEDADQQAEDVLDKVSKLTEAVNQTAAEADELEAQLNTITDILEQQYEETFTLQLLHVSDMGGSVGALGDVENFSAILDGFRRQLPNNTLVLSSGDNYVPGPRYYAANDGANIPLLGVPGNGRGDIALLNAMGFQASCSGQPRA